ncbi:MAG: ATP-binding cassette domain-containing protein [Bacillus sp. (in: firmicutes)]
MPQVHYLMGVNGTGKSTTFKMIAGIGRLKGSRCF